MGPPACKTGEQGVDTAYLMPGVPSFTSLARQTPDFPYLTPEDIQACFAFAAERERSMRVTLA